MSEKSPAQQGTKTSAYLKCITLLRTFMCFSYIISAGLLLRLRRHRRTVSDTWLTWWAAKLIDIFKLQVRYHRRSLPIVESNRPIILMSNHSSMIDIPLIINALPEYSIRMLAKKELSYIPLFGTAMRYAEFVFIDRHNKNQALTSLSQAKQLLERGIVLWIAPEGQRSSHGELLPFKSGPFHLAISCQAVIIPIFISGAHHVLPKQSFWNMSLNRSVQLAVGDPIECQHMHLASRHLLAKRVRDQLHQLKISMLNSGDSDGTL